MTGRIATIPLDPEHRRALFQLLRYAITGGGLTLAVAGGYWLLATPLHIDPNLSLAIVFMVFSGIGFILHSRFSFRDHGVDGNGGRGHVVTRSLRYFGVHIAAFALNQFFVWYFVAHLGGPTWWPILPIVFVTPLLTFVVLRLWVFGHVAPRERTRS